MIKRDMVRLAENLDRLDKLRRQTRNAYIFTAGVYILMAFIIFRIMDSRYLASSTLYYSSIYIAATVGTALPITCAKIRRRYKKLYNAVIVRNSLEQYFEVDEFNSDYGVSRGLIESTNMIRTGNNFKSDDFLKGRYKDINFMQSDVLMEDRASFSEYIKSKPITYFKGRWMIFEFNKRFKCDLLIFEKSFMLRKNKFSIFSGNNYDKIEFESAQFNENFDCYTNNQTEAFYVLTPHLMESIEEIRQKTNGALLLCFKNNMLHVGVNCGKWAFEPPIFSPVDVSRVQGEIDSDIQLITQFVDDLKLDEKVYKID